MTPPSLTLRLHAGRNRAGGPLTRAPVMKAALSKAPFVVIGKAMCCTGKMMLFQGIMCWGGQLIRNTPKPWNRQSLVIRCYCGT